MTIASLLIAVLTTAYAPPSDATAEPVLFHFHAEWCGPCQKMRRAVEQLSRQGYPVKSIDIDQSPELAKRYRVQSVPTFIVVDGSGRVLDRTSGLQPAADLARFYRAAVVKAQPPANSNAHVGSRERTGEGDQDGDNADSDSDEPPRRVVRGQNAADPPDEADDHDEPAFTNPKPWETVVRIKVMNAHSIGFGSGTVIYSTPEESLIITCAHIFKLDGRRQAPPSQFPRRIMIDLFDGKLRGTSPAQVHYLETVEGKAVDYDFVRDVGLIRIRPGRRLPACRVVPAHWEPLARMKMLTVGCSEGHDATAWHTSIVRPRMTGFLAGNTTYEAVECLIAPKQGRSGGGLFTEDGYIAGICNFAEPQGDHGLYATPRSIYSVLDRNNLMALYAPVTRGSGTLLADGRASSRARRSAPVSVARSQSPDQEEPDRNQRRANSKKGEVMIPPPNLLGIADPVSPEPAQSARPASRTTRHTAWHPTPIGPSEGERSSLEGTEATDLSLDPAVDNDRFGPAPRGILNHEGDAHVGDVEPADLGLGSSAAVPPTTRWRRVTVPSVQPTDGAGER